MEKEVLEAYERLLSSAFREGRDKFGSFADEATIVDGGRWFGSLAEYRAAWDAWKETIGHFGLPASVETRVMSLQMLGDPAVLVHSIESRERTDAGEETEREIETIVFGRQPSGRWLIVHQHLSHKVLKQADNSPRPAQERPTSLGWRETPVAERVAGKKGGGGCAPVVWEA